MNATYTAQHTPVHGASGSSSTAKSADRLSDAATTGGIPEAQRRLLVDLLSAFPVRSIAECILLRDGVATLRADVEIEAISLDQAATLYGLAAGLLPPEALVAKPIIDESASATAWPRNLPHLSRRQMEVLRLLSKGKSNKQIAIELGTTEGTVKTHNTLIFRKLHAKTRTQAVMEAGKLLGPISDNPHCAQHPPVSRLQFVAAGAK